MKTKLITSKENEIVGYNNVFYQNLEYIDNNSCFELYIDNDVLKLINNNDFENFIKECCSKIRLSGLLIITGRDIMKISLSYIHKYITEKEFSNLLSYNIGFYNCRMVEEEIKKNNLKIHSMFITDYNFVVRANRG